ncbi:Carbonyl reductase [NADPH] 1 [Myotis brandtii]|uniref:Carbonyl reductase [NADPH] 1 n=1 Tax=Myotis brandtii TaxID=109478 RepID=S7PAF0_MYOBR|nr:Carbonyl reductase [NADPH] 1 [Myotis brandtii]
MPHSPLVMRQKCLRGNVCCKGVYAEMLRCKPLAPSALGPGSDVCGRDFAPWPEPGFPHPSRERCPARRTPCMDGTAWHRAGPAPTRALEMLESWPEAAFLTSVTAQTRTRQAQGVSLLSNRRAPGARALLAADHRGEQVVVNDPTPFHIKAEVTMKTNFFGTRDVCTELLPLMKPQGRVVNVSSMESLRALKNCSPELQQKFRSDTISEEELVGLMNKFVEDARNGVHQREGWPNRTYGVTKIGVTVLSRIHARNLSAHRRGDKILLNACCPGWVRTDLTGPQAPKSPEEGAETPVFLALLPSDAEGPHGQFLFEKKVEQWTPASHGVLTPVALETVASKGTRFAITPDLCRRFLGKRRSLHGTQCGVGQLCGNCTGRGLGPCFHHLDIHDL